ncbi:MAG: hydrogenase maturation nickel metallochaperone HypA [Myxococcota bacterium]|nr:hydrogenase maturation nickel metallochaperone HypA [Myxococcota bacterium]
MHEWSLVEDLLRQVERHADRHGASRVVRVHLAVGELSGVEVPLLERAFETFRAATRCRDGALDVRRVPARWRCPGCGREAPAGGPLFCDACALPPRLVEGDEMILERIEMEVE